MKQKIPSCKEKRTRAICYQTVRDGNAKDWSRPCFDFGAIDAAELIDKAELALETSMGSPE